MSLAKSALVNNYFKSSKSCSRLYQVDVACQWAQRAYERMFGYFASVSGRVARLFSSVLPTIDLSVDGMIPLGQFILWFFCLACDFVFVFEFVFEFAGAPFFVCLWRRAGGL
jgi:hypothetical protein